MKTGRHTRRRFTCCLVACFLAQIAWSDFNAAARQSTVANLNGHHLVRAPRGTHGLGSRTPQVVPVSNAFSSWQPGTTEKCFDFNPQVSVSMLSTRRTSHPGLPLSDISRFGRAPPSVIL
jgi:hypothetical protein